MLITLGLISVAPYCKLTPWSFNSGLFRSNFGWQNFTYTLPQTAS